MNAVCTSPTFVNGKLVRAGRTVPLQKGEVSDLSTLKLAELRKVANDHNVDVSSAKTKAEIVALIEDETGLRSTADEAETSS